MDFHKLGFSFDDNEKSKAEIKKLEIKNKIYRKSIHGRDRKINASFLSHKDSPINLQQSPLNLQVVFLSENARSIYTS